MDSHHHQDQGVLFPKIEPKKPPNLTPGARLLFDLLRRLNRLPKSQKEGGVFASQGWLARELGTTTRTVQRQLELLHLLGKVHTRESPGKKNLYILDQAGVVTPTTRMSSHPRRGRRDTHDADVVPPTTPASSPCDKESELRETESNSNRKPDVGAAAAVPPAEENPSPEGATTRRQPIRGASAPEAQPSAMTADQRNAIVAEVVALDLPHSLAERAVDQRPDWGFFKEVLAFYECQRKAGRLRDPVSSLRSMIEHPERWGIERTEAGWQSPRSDRGSRDRSRFRYRSPDGA